MSKYKKFLLPSILVVAVVIIIVVFSFLGKGKSEVAKSEDASAIGESVVATVSNQAQSIQETKVEATQEAAKPVAATAQVVPAFSNISYYLNNKLDEYQAYSIQHPELSLETVVTYVNIGLNNPFYSNTKQVQNPSDILVLCNKYNYLSSDYEPSDLTPIASQNDAAGNLKLRKEAADAFNNLCEGARKDGYTILGASAYRSYSYQKSLYNNYVAADGTAKADTYSARAGYSEHQTGLAIDVKNATVVYDNFGSTPEYQWAKNNIYKYGFIIRYEPDKTNITGYKSEEWHFRYVGIDTAKTIHDLGITFDEYCARYLVNKIN